MSSDDPYAATNDPYEEDDTNAYEEDGTGSTTGDGTGSTTGSATGSTTGSGTGSTTGSGTGSTTGDGTDSTTGSGTDSDEEDDTNSNAGSATGSTTGSGTHDPYEEDDDPYEEDDDPYEDGTDSDEEDGTDSDDNLDPFSLFQGFSPGEQFVTDGPLSIGEPLSDDAPAQTTAGDTDGWWGVDTDLPATSWKNADHSALRNLKRVPSMNDEDDPPWDPGYRLDIQGCGGLVSKERRRYTLVGHEGTFANQIRGNQTVAADYHSTRVRKHRSVTIAKTEGSDGLDASWGRDRLTVAGNASYEFYSRTLMMSGMITRNWNGGIMRLAAMEGVVCGGAMVRTIAGPAGTMSQMMTGDVYGGIARVSAVRSYLAVLQYRAAKDAAWAIGVWVRRTTFTIVPVTPAPPQVTPTGNAARKMSRLSKTASKAAKVTRKSVSGMRMICPVVDIALGLLSIPLAIVGIAMLLKGLFGKGSKNAVPPAGPPRVLNTNSGMTMEMYMSKKFT